MGDNVKRVGMVDASRRGVFLFRSDRTQISTVYDYAVIHCNVSWGASGSRITLYLALTAVVYLGIYSDVLEIEQRFLRQLRQLHVQRHV